MAKVTLDVTGFYFHFDVEVPANSSVKDVMTEVQTKTDGKDRELKFHGIEKKGKGEFLKELSVLHRIEPVSRQDPNRKYPKGLYWFNDEMAYRSNPQLVWQYYISDGKGTLLTGPESSGLRSVVPYSLSNVGFGGAPGVQLADGFVIVWRLVAIFVGPTKGSVKAFA